MKPWVGVLIVVGLGAVIWLSIVVDNIEQDKDGIRELRQAQLKRIPKLEPEGWVHEKLRQISDKYKSRG